MASNGRMVVNLKGFGRKRLSPVSRYYPGGCLKGPRKSTTKSVWLTPQAQFSFLYILLRTSWKSLLKKTEVFEILGLYNRHNITYVSMEQSGAELVISKGRNSSVGIMLGYGLDDRSSRVPSGGGAGNFSLHHRVRNGSGTHPVSYPMGTRGSFPGGKAAGAWSWPLTSI
jgi:hypothetical protein